MAVVRVEFKGSEGSCSGTRSNHTDTLADILDVFPQADADPSACMQACCNRSQCTYYTFVYKQPLGESTSVEAGCPPGTLNCCWLKQGAGKLLPEGGCPECVSGSNPSDLHVRLSILDGSSSSSQESPSKILTSSDWI